MTEYGDMTLDQYRDALASNEPTPGGGSAAAVALTQGAALAIMVCELTVNKEKWVEGWGPAQNTLDVATPLLERGYELATEDAHSFDDVMLAFKMPKESEEQILERRNAIHNGTLKAAMVPLETAKHSLQLLETLPTLAETGNGNAVTDVGVAGLLISAACKGALFNVEINLNSLPDNVGEEMRVELDSLREKCRITSKNVMHSVHDRMHC